MPTWPLQEAKARFSELVRRAAVEGPQEITVHGEPAAVLVSRAEFDRMSRPASSFVAFMRASPLVGVELDLERDRYSDWQVACGASYPWIHQGNLSPGPPSQKPLRAGG